MILPSQELYRSASRTVSKNAGVLFMKSNGKPGLDNFHLSVSQY